ncbi:DUF2690 domain-containing protein [Promicromonospora sp. NPDC050249]|uniref:DUF2690 domain-containing protein n=1 Tax=Promicromonospora sp. NPDC050249 TaxID=3154743 RepID=UPI0033FB9491
MTSKSIPRILVRLFTATLALVLTSVGLSAIATTSAAAATCSYTSCDGQDPEATGCSAGATTVRSARNVQVRYSPTCKAYWSRYLDSGECYGIDKVHIYKYNTASGNVVRHYSVTAGCGTAWTRMVGTANSETRWFQGMNETLGLEHAWTSVITDRGPCTSCESIPESPE